MASEAPKDDVPQDKPQDFEPPLACVSRIIKNNLKDVQIGKDAKAAFAKAAGIFVIYVTACANEFCRDGKRQTINSKDILNALKELGFEDFIQPLEEFLAHHRSEMSAKKTSQENAKKITDQADSSAKETPSKASGEGENDDEDVEGEEEEEEEEDVAEDSAADKRKDAADGEEAAEEAAEDGDAAKETKSNGDKDDTEDEAEEGKD